MGRNKKYFFITIAPDSWVHFGFFNFVVLNEEWPDQQNLVKKKTKKMIGRHENSVMVVECKMKKNLIFSIKKKQNIFKFSTDFVLYIELFKEIRLPVLRHIHWWPNVEKRS